MAREHPWYASIPENSYTENMHRTTVVLDTKKLAKVQRVLGTTGIKETIERAFDEILAVEIRKRHVERLIKQEGIDLAKPDVMAKAWR